MLTAPAELIPVTTTAPFVTALAVEPEAAVPPVAPGVEVALNTVENPAPDDGLGKLIEDAADATTGPVGKLVGGAITEPDAPAAPPAAAPFLALAW